ncbi:hypothetical protein AURDEDRAFT_163571 [Auricularia subglabra TFB-10046 SS5]|nr:hypothetical protein AURDEDRAFT_163571 [Auricularia subglabra TFB-10046 SS5]
MGTKFGQVRNLVSHPPPPPPPPPHGHDPPPGARAHTPPPVTAWSAATYSQEKAKVGHRKPLENVLQAFECSPREVSLHDPGVNDLEHEEQQNKRLMKDHNDFKFIVQTPEGEYRQPNSTVPGYHAPPPILLPSSPSFPLVAAQHNLSYAAVPCETITVRIGSETEVLWRLFSGSTAPLAPIPNAVPGDIYWTPNDHQVWQLQRFDGWKLLDTSTDVAARLNAHPTVQPPLTLRYWPSRGDKKPKYIPATTYRAAKSKAQASRKRSYGQLESAGLPTVDDAASARPLPDNTTAPPVMRTTELNVETAEHSVLEDIPPEAIPEPEPVFNPAPKPTSVRGGYAIRGTELPSKAEVIPMYIDDEKFDVCLPYLSRHLYKKKYAKASYDSMIMEIKDVVGARSAKHDEKFVSFDTTEPNLRYKIADALARNCVVRVRKYYGDSGFVEWEDADVDILDPNAIVTPHSQTRRLCGDPKNYGEKGYQIQRRMKFIKFLEASTNTSKCYNLLDCNSHKDSPPGFLKTIMAERSAFTAMYNQGLLVRGMSKIDSDMLNPLQWWLLAHSGYYTAAHHDSCGYCTWIWVHTGVKLWSWQRLPAHMSKRIQPPNLVHRVYTAERSIVMGGHFYCFQTMHLTELARLIDVDYNELATNEDHEGVHRLFARMVMRLGTGFTVGTRVAEFRGLSERCILALLRMVISRSDYVIRPREQKGAGGDLENEPIHVFDADCLPEGLDNDDDDGDWSDPDDDAGAHLEHAPPKYEDRGSLDAVEQDEHADFFTAVVISRLLIRHLGAEGRLGRDSYDQDGLSWEEPGPPIDSLPDLPVTQILDVAEARLKKAAELAPKNKHYTTQPFVLDGKRELKYVDDVVKKVEAMLRVQLKTATKETKESALPRKRTRR